MVRAGKKSSDTESKPTGQSSSASFFSAPQIMGFLRKQPRQGPSSTALDDPQMCVQVDRPKPDGGLAGDENVEKQWPELPLEVARPNPKVDLPARSSQQVIELLNHHSKNLKHAESQNLDPNEEDILQLQDMKDLNIEQDTSGPGFLISKELKLSRLRTRLKVYDDFRYWIEDKVSENFTELSSKMVDAAIEGMPPFARGGFGDVYRVKINEIEFALKVPRSADELEGKSAFNKEVMILKRIIHPNIVTLKGACLERAVLAYEYLSGGTLEDQLSAGRAASFSWKRRISVGFQICSALVFLHATQPIPIAHGDLKPSNVLFDDNQCAKLSDFGISRHLCVSTTSGTPGHLTDNPKGSGAYMDPNFSDTKMLTTQSDIYAFGIILLELVTGRGASGLRAFVSKQVEMLDKMSEEKRRRMVCKLKIADPRWNEDDESRAAAIGILYLGLRCSSSVRQDRPDLESDIWPHLHGCLELVKDKQ